MTPPPAYGQLQGQNIGPLFFYAMNERTERWMAQYLAGVSTDEIGRQSGVTGQRVRQVLSSEGLGRHNAGPYQKARERKSTNHARWLSVYLPNFGCSRAEMIEANDGSFRRNAPKARAYLAQRNTAIHRKISWDLTFPLWCFLWHESGHWEDRGRHKWGMARIDFDQGFHFDNVRICFHQEAAADNIRHWRAKKTASSNLHNSVLP